jgi:hypothetical protein
MKKAFFILLSCTFSTLFAAAQAKHSTEYLKIDSLILSKAPEKLTAEPALTRGGSVDPCDRDLSSLKSLFSNLKRAYIKCCNNQSTDAAVLRMLASISEILDNSSCKWDDNPSMYAVLLFYWADYNSLVNRMNCSGCNGE